MTDKSLWRQRETLCETLSYCTWQTCHCDYSVKDSLKHSVIVRDRQVTVTTAWNIVSNTQLLYVTDKSLWRQRETLSKVLSYCTWQTSNCDDSMKNSVKHSVIVRDSQVTATTAWNTLWNTQLLYVSDRQVTVTTAWNTLWNTQLLYVSDRQVTATTAWNTLWNTQLLDLTDRSLWLQHETLSETLSYCTWQTRHCDDSDSDTLGNTHLLYVTDTSLRRQHKTLSETLSYCTWQTCHCDDSVKHSMKHSVIVRDRQVTATTSWNTLWSTQLLYVTHKSLLPQDETLSETLSYCTWWRSHCDDSEKHYMKN